MSEEIKVTDEDRLDYYQSIVPHGYMDIDAAIIAAKEAGYDADWVGEQVARMVEECQMKVENIDPVGEVYESILQEARSEIEQNTDYDLCNDVKARTGIYTAGNYCCTSYDYSEEAIEELVEILKEKEVDIEDLGQSTQWFLKEVGVTTERIGKLTE